ncbi:MAG: hypothetical protein LBR81_05215 [Prevotellaceae bacterium]|jgi:hypothetical protein|nr:hypothetical protein [Prevotellaceae bacterium]
MKTIYKYLVLAAISLALSGCTFVVDDEPQYCYDADIEVYNDTPYAIYYSLDRDYCRYFLAPYSSVIIRLGAIDIYPHSPDIQPFNYRFDNQGPADVWLDIPIDDCYQTIYLD